MNQGEFRPGSNAFPSSEGISTFRNRGTSQPGSPDPLFRVSVRRRGPPATSRSAAPSAAAESGTPCELNYAINVADPADTMIALAKRHHDLGNVQVPKEPTRCLPRQHHRRADSQPRGQHLELNDGADGPRSTR